MKISWHKNIKFNARSDGSLRYEKTSDVIINTPSIKKISNLPLKIISFVVKVYRKIRSEFSS